MKQRHNPDARAYHEYYLNQAGRGYPVYVGTRYQRGHGLGSIFGSLFKSVVPLLKGGAKTLGSQNPLKDVDSRVFTRMLRKDGRKDGRTEGQLRYYIPSQLRWRGDNNIESTYFDLFRENVILLSFIL